MEHLLQLIIVLVLTTYHCWKGCKADSNFRVQFVVNTFDGGSACSNVEFKFTVTYPADGENSFLENEPITLGNDQLNQVFTVENLTEGRQVSFKWQSVSSSVTLQSCCWYVSNVTLYKDDHQLPVQPLCTSTNPQTLQYCNGIQWICTPTVSSDQILSLLLPFDPPRSSFVSGTYKYGDGQLVSVGPCSNTSQNGGLVELSLLPDWPCDDSGSQQSTITGISMTSETATSQQSTAMSTSLYTTTTTISHTTAPMAAASSVISSSPSNPTATGSESMEIVPSQTTSNSFTTTSGPFITNTNLITTISNTSAVMTTTNSSSVALTTISSSISKQTPSLLMSTTTAKNTNHFSSIQTTTTVSSSLPYHINTTLPSSIYLIAPSNNPSADYCPEDGPWRATPAGLNATLNNACCNESAPGTRRCGADGIWDANYHCTVSEQFSSIILSNASGSLDNGLELLQVCVSDPDTNLPVNQYLLLLETVIDVYQRDNMSIIDDTTVRMILNITNDIIGVITPNNGTDNNQLRDQGIQILRILDRLALTVIPPTNEILQSNNIALTVMEFNEPPPSDIKNIQVNRDSITTPRSVYNPSIETESPVRVASFHFRNLSQLLPPSDPNSTIVSSIISATTNCTTCPIDNLMDQNVTIQLQIENTLQENELVSCVFVRLNHPGQQDWNTSGCTTSVNGDLVTCSCNHLTHFAILLSPKGDSVSPKHIEVLNTIGLVLVPISLLCMMLVILTYTLIRSLWSIRNYIHIMLCGSLFMAQLVFIIGVDKIENKGACSAVAVILLYLFLVTFMWMLMEGVVLYVTLVQVFITNHIYYAIVFTVASYVIPALYMALVVPLGFLVNADVIPGHTHFLYYIDDDLVACWLNYQSGFIAVFIAPVCLVVMANMCFFIMAICVMKRHYNKQEHKEQAKAITVKHWLRVSFSFTLVMGITWVIGILAFLEELIFIFYIYTIFVASQGVLLFLILVPFSKQVREAFFEILEPKMANSEKLAKFVNFLASSSTTASARGNRTSSHNKMRAGNNTAADYHKTSGGIMLGSYEASPDSMADLLSSRDTNSTNTN